MSEFDFTGSSRILNDFKDIDGNISFDDIFPREFMKKYTRFRSFKQFLQSSDFHIFTAEDLTQIPDDMLDSYVRRVTKFESWEAMLLKATENLDY